MVEFWNFVIVSRSFWMVRICHRRLQMKQDDVFMGRNWMHQTKAVEVRTQKLADEIRTKMDVWKLCESSRTHWIKLIKKKKKNKMNNDFFLFLFFFLEIKLSEGEQVQFFSSNSSSQREYLISGGATSLEWELEQQRRKSDYSSWSTAEFIYFQRSLSFFRKWRFKTV